MKRSGKKKLAKMPREPFAHPKCYAKRLGDCSTIISSEHYISESILIRIGGGKMITVGGASWLNGGEPKSIAVGSFAANVLCDRHNSQLSPLDTVALNVFNLLVGCETQEDVRRAPKHLLVRVSGWDFERWFVKAFCGLHAAGHLGDQPELPDYLIESLFLRKPLPHDFGLYFGAVLDEVLWMSKSLVFTTLFRPDTREACGFFMNVAGLGFQCSLRPANDGGTGIVDGKQRLFHGFKFDLPGRVREVEFNWTPETKLARVPM
jgi:hypothetical protein